MKAENLNSLWRAERMMVRWMCGVSLKDRRRNVDLYSLLGFQSMAEVVRRGQCSGMCGEASYTVVQERENV